MAIKTFKDGICKDTHVIGYNTYIEGNDGQGCDTIWYKNVSVARAVVKAFKGKVPTGHDFNLCERCDCHYSAFSPNSGKYPGFVCKALKKAFAKSWE